MLQGLKRFLRFVLLFLNLLLRTLLSKRELRMLISLDPLLLLGRHHLLSLLYFNRYILYMMLCILHLLLLIMLLFLLYLHLILMVYNMPWCSRSVPQIWVQVRINRYMIVIVVTPTDGCVTH